MIHPNHKINTKLPELTILRDSREKEGKGWFFEEEAKKPGNARIVGTIVLGLDAGDYTIKGYQDLVRIERKYGFAELFENLMNREGKQRFENELDKLKDVKHKYLVVESSINDDIMSLSVPQYRGGPTVSRVIDQLLQYQITHDLVPIFAGPSGKKIARKIFLELARQYRI